ncbi:AAA family ATPase [Corynebacterium canis]|uniref:AAA family ATPase n=1 Tax=Corynebacterium canis TaxID=679663 RepID=A0A5C5UI63_9CORY|nr:AAA family ATPase [Corynebacterium canis]TWT25678.1 AAA family ATPase [Corynebacterium canis]WJY74013.1 ATP-dependent zinc metalloprotease FtsH [Corynebacterium canis]
MNEAAIDALRQALAVHPDPQLRVTLAELLLASDRPEEAMVEATEVLKQNPAEQRATAVLTAAASKIAQPKFDWDTAEEQVKDTERVVLGPSDDAPPALFEPTTTGISFRDVGGLEHVKQRLDEAFIQPMKNARIAKAFGKSLRGGLLLYGPPGCGKTFIARAVAGQLGADFRDVAMTDLVSSYRGDTERNIHAVFEEVRAAQRPTVLFLDELDSLALRRSSLRGSASWLRGSVNQLLLEMDSIQENNDSLFVLAASNHPWDIDDAFLRPGRFDRTVLVPPPDAAARYSILKSKLSNRPTGELDLQQLVTSTGRFSGADLDHLCVSAAEKAMTDSIAAEKVLPISMKHFQDALKEIQPSIGEWMESARNVVRYANQSGRYSELAEYLREYDNTVAGGKSGRPSSWWR